MSNVTEPYLTLAFPIKDGEARLGEAIAGIEAFRAGFDRPTEVLFVDDGSRDSTADKLAELARSSEGLRVVTHEVNRGKGAALKTAAAHARGELLATIDADASFDLGILPRYLEHLERGDAAAIGNRRDPGTEFSLPPAACFYVGLRHVLGGIYGTLARAITGLEVRDTQCGFKCYRTAIARRYFPEVDADGFAFDGELLAILQYHAEPIAELPVLFRYHRQPSTVRMFSDGGKMLAHLLRVRSKIQRWRRGASGDAALAQERRARPPLQ